MFSALGTWVTVAALVNCLFAGRTLAVPHPVERPNQVQHASVTWSVAVSSGFSGEGGAKRAALSNAISTSMALFPELVNVAVYSGGHVHRRQLQSAGGTTALTVQYTVRCGVSCDDIAAHLTGDAAVAHATALLAGIEAFAVTQGFPNAIVSTPADVAASITTPQLVQITLPPIRSGDGDYTGPASNFVSVSDDFGDALADTGGFVGDCVLTPDEIAVDEEAAAMAAAFAATQAVALGVSVDDVVVTGIAAVDGQGCGVVPHTATAMDVDVSAEYVNSITDGGVGFLDDCYISPSEYAADPDAQAFVDAIIAAHAASISVDPRAVTVAGISTDDDDEPGCTTSSGRRMQNTARLSVQFEFRTPEQQHRAVTSVAIRV
eukprot:SAG22_NODE_161_length_16908_cov_39.687965_21_plen_377_part_00